MYAPTKPVEVRVPHLEQPVALGEALKKLFASVGAQPCGGCQKRAGELDRRLIFVPWRQR